MSEALWNVIYATLGISNAFKHSDVIRAGGFDFFSNALAAPSEQARNFLCEHLTQYDFYGPALILKCADEDRLYVDICEPNDVPNDVVCNLFDPFAYVTPPQQNLIPEIPWAPVKNYETRIKRFKRDDDEVSSASSAKKQLWVD
jgi:hypothetical protein